MNQSPKYYLPDGNMEDFSDAEIFASLQHYHYERSCKFKRKALNAVGKPYYPMLHNIQVWHENMSNFLMDTMHQNK